VCLSNFACIFFYYYVSTLESSQKKRVQNLNTGNKFLPQKNIQYCTGREVQSLVRKYYNKTLTKKQNECDRNYCTTKRKPAANFSVGRSNANVTPQGDAPLHSPNTSTETIPRIPHDNTNYLPLPRNFCMQLQNLSSTYIIEGAIF
jgi:hypothetical protein